MAETLDVVEMLKRGAFKCLIPDNGGESGGGEGGVPHLPPARHEEFVPLQLVGFPICYMCQQEVPNIPVTTQHLQKIHPNPNNKHRAHCTDPIYQPLQSCAGAAMDHR
jgi:hypothetical protein